MSSSVGAVFASTLEVGRGDANAGRDRRLSTSQDGAEPEGGRVAYERSITFPLTKQQDSQNIRRDALQQQAGCPPYGSKSVIGRRAKMEDACVAIPYLLDVPMCEHIDELVPPRIAPQLRSASGSSRSSETTMATAAAVALSEAMQPGSSALDSSNHCGAGDVSHHSRQGDTGACTVETVHFFGVFDGHGGAEAALHCARTMHERVRETLTSLMCPTPPAASPTDAGADAGPETSSTTLAHAGPQDALPLSGAEQANQARSVPASHHASASNDTNYLEARTDISSHSSGSSYLECDLEEAGDGNKVEGVQCTSETFESALTKAFHLTDEEFGALGGYEHLALVGTTAVVALVGNRMMYVANCGDSRAVLLREGQALALTDDHKAAREDETARVEAAGGQILFWNGVRVMGLLAVSRAIGDHSLRPYVIAQPEVTIVNRCHGDELLVMASDGLWDVMSNQEACTLAKKCLTRAQQRGSSRQSAARVAATVLTRAAVDRGSRDNVTVVIVDLSADGAAENDIGAPSADTQLDVAAPESESRPREERVHHGAAR